VLAVKNNKGEEIEFGSIGGGGRYDDLVKRFNNQDCPSTGISVGLDPSNLCHSSKK
jgi:histidyl-tRNA synthetase